MEKRPARVPLLPLPSARAIAIAVAVGFPVTGGVVACDSATPTTLVVESGYDAAAALRPVVFRVWYAATLVDEPLSSGAASEPLRTVPGTDYAYALVARGWDPASETPPAALFALRSKDKLTAHRGEELRVRVSDATFDGDCVTGHALAQLAADFVTQRIFPGPFAGGRYDAATCAIVLGASDGGVDAGADGEADASGADAAETADAGELGDAGDAADDSADGDANP
jgi:hypothetical protein